MRELPPYIKVKDVAKACGYGTDREALDSMRALLRKANALVPHLSPRCVDTNALRTGAEAAWAKVVLWFDGQQNTDVS